MTTFTILNKEMEHTTKKVKSLEDSCSLIKRVAQTIKNETKKQRGGFLMLLGTLDASLLGNMFAEKGFIREMVMEQQAQSTGNN